MIAKTRNILTIFAVLLTLLGLASGAQAQNLGGISTAPTWQLKGDGITGQTDGAALASWTATAGPTPTQATSANQPIYHASGPNSKPYVTFGALNFLSTASLSVTGGTYSMFTVTRLPSSGFSDILDTPSGRLIVYTNVLGNIGFFTGGFQGVSTAPAGGAWLIAEWRFDGSAGTCQVFVNGNSVGTSTAYTSTPIGGNATVLGNTIGAASGNDNPAGDVAEYALYNSLLSSNDRNAVGAALASKYGVSTSYVNPATTIAPNSTGILYSPYNWLVTGTSAKTINAGAYFRTLIVATNSCSVNLNIGTATPYSQVKARVDGGSWQTYTPTASGQQAFALTMPQYSTSTTHLVEFGVKSATQTTNVWDGGQPTAVQVTGLTLDSGGSVSIPIARKYRILVYGDSITAGVRDIGGTAIAVETNRDDGTLTYAYRLGDLLNAEVGVVGFGAQGWTVAGSGDTPPLPSTYNLLWQSQARSFSIVPDLVIYNEGTNDQGSTDAQFQAAVGSVINGIGYTATTFSGMAGTRHLVLRPLNGAYATQLASEISSINNGNISFGDTTGVFVVADSPDALHPYVYSHLAKIGPSVAALAVPLLRPASSSSNGLTSADVQTAVTAALTAQGYTTARAVKLDTADAASHWNFSIKGRPAWNYDFLNGLVLWGDTAATQSSTSTLNAYKIPGTTTTLLNSSVPLNTGGKATGRTETVGTLGTP